MQLSYACRLICLTLCSAGLLQLLLEFIAWQVAPSLFRQVLVTSARRGERALFLLALFGRLGPLLVVSCVLGPAYILGEDNLSSERVGFFCLSAAAGVLVWSLFCWIRTLHSWVLAQRCCRLCHEEGRSPEGFPLLLHPGHHPMLAVVGVFRSRIIVSRSLLASARFPAKSLALALRHEGSHARQHDNLKLLLLSMLPHIPLATRERPSLQQQWRLATEMAADEDGVMGQPEGSVLLAEMLVAMARMSNDAVLRCSFGSLSRPEDLSVRVRRLLKPVQSNVQSSIDGAPLYTASMLAWAAAMLVTLCYLCAQFGHRAAEILLHIG